MLLRPVHVRCPVEEEDWVAVVGHRRRKCSQAFPGLRGKVWLLRPSGKPHILLIVTDGHVVCWTEWAQAYPLNLARAIAISLFENVRKQLMLRGSEGFAGRKNTCRPDGSLSFLSALCACVCRFEAKRIL